MATLQQVLNFFEYIFPSSSALPDDRTGLQIKGGRNQIYRILVALELNRGIFDKVMESKIDFLYLHHPPLWTPLYKLTSDDPWCQIVTQLFHEGISVLAHHTNLDLYPGGIADQWITILQFFGQVKAISPRPTTSFKVVTYVPPDYIDSISQALFQAGAGKFGSYQSCSFWVEGIGTFLPLEGAQPFIGKVGNFERVKEIRLEVTFSDSHLIEQLLNIVKKIHPYQKPVIDIYPIQHYNSELEGLGRLIELSKPLQWNELIHRFQPFIKIENPIFTQADRENRLLQKIALCPGSGGGLLEQVISGNSDVYITGDLNHHQIEKLKLYKIDYCPIPHGESERIGLKKIFEKIKK